MTTYLLVHPERFPSNDDGVIGAHLPEGASLAGIDEWYGEWVSAQAASCVRQVALLDDFGFEDVEEDGELLSGVGAEGWELVACSPEEVGRVVRRIFQGSGDAVIVGGFARHDCVARAAKALRKLELEVTLDERGVLPLSAEGAQAYLERASPRQAPPE